MEKVLELTDKNFDQEVLKSSLPVLVDFWAPWCGPCKMIGPIIDELAEEYKGKANIVKINIDENSETSAEYEIRSIPTILIFKDGYIVESVQGSKAKSELKQLLDKHIVS